ncbi:MAG: asparaginase [Anaerolineae bacterium]|nr:asparaginase [Anaerolineae bacterium]
MKIKIFTTGGSIDKAYSTQESRLVVAGPQVANILDEANVTIEWEVQSILKKDSLELTDGDREMIVEQVRQDPHRHIILTHGTDTMIETAQALSSITGKVIVLTGSMQPAAFQRSDAAFNVGGAIIAVQTLPEGIYLVMNGQVFDPDRASKNLVQNRFES